MKTVTSKDGTRIAWDEAGRGPPVLLVDGAMCGRSFGPMADLSALLAPRFRVLRYDRRGRGDSGDTKPYAVEREVEDIAALVDAAGGPVHLYGASSGAVLAARAAASGIPVRSLVLFEPPLALDGVRVPDPPDFRERIDASLRAGRPGDAVKMFMKVVGVPGFGIAMMQLMRGVWRNLKAFAPTLPYDFAVLGDTQSGGAMPDELAQKLASIRVPTQVLLGGKSPPWMQHAVKRVATSIPGATTRVLPGQSHNAAAKAVAPALLDHFGAEAPSPGVVHAHA